MPYRSRRERRYRRKTAKAAAPRPGYAGGWGKGSPIRRSDLLLVATAIRERWAIPRETKTAIISRVFELFDEADATGDVRMSAAVCRLVITLQGDNIRRIFEAIDAAEAELTGVPWATDQPRGKQ